MKKKLFPLLILIFSISCAGMGMPPVGSPQTGYSLWGYVAKSYQVAAPNEVVSLLNGDTGTILSRTQSNVFGQFTFSGLKPGYYQLRVGEFTLDEVISNENKRLDIDFSKPGGRASIIGDAVDQFMEEAKKASSAAVGGVSNSDPEMVKSIAGKYWGYTGSTESTIALCPDGSFTDSSDSSYSGTGYDSGGNETMNWGTANQSGGSGSWAIQGTLQQGTITVKAPNGNVKYIGYKAGAERGCFYFDGSQMCYNGACK